MTDTPRWLPEDFAHPLRHDLPGGQHLRPIRADDVALDYPAVMNSRDRLWTIFGPAWGWPPSTMTIEQDRADLARHEEEITAHLSFNYAIFDAAETALLGCVYLDPPEKAGADAEISWWVVDAAVDTPLDHVLGDAVVQWVHDSWPFVAPRYIGRDLSWDEWLALPDR